MADPIRVANCSGFYGDRVSAAAEMVEGGHIDALTGDWLAELTMLILARTRAKRPGGGYARTFVRQMEEVMGTCLDRGIRVVANAGGLDPDGCAEAVAEVADNLGLSPTIAYVAGDDLLPRLDDLLAAGHDLPDLVTGEPLADPSGFVSANAYLGCWGIVEALERGADIVVTGRTTDACEYAQALQQQDHGYDVPFQPPPTVDENAIASLLNYTKAAGRAQAGYEDPASQRLQWFTTGSGRALAGVTESLATFPVDQIQNYTVRAKPLAPASAQGENCFFVDGVGINPRTPDTASAQALAQVMTSLQVLGQGCRARAADENPQYLIPARQSVLDDLANQYPLYSTIRTIVLGSPRHAFTVDASVRDWLTAQGAVIRDQLLENTVPENDTIVVDDHPIHPSLAHLPVNLARKR